MHLGGVKIETWALKECGRAEFGDGLLTQRLVTVVSTLSEHPSESLPEAAESWGELKGIYRFYDNARVGHERILLAHRKATLGMY